VKECPSPETYDLLLQGHLSSDERLAALAHLRDCLPCAGVAGPAFLRADEQGLLPLPPGAPAGGDALDRAVATALAAHARLQIERKLAPRIARGLLADYQSFDAIPAHRRPELATWAICEALLAECAALLHEDVFGALTAAQLAAGAADHLHPKRYSQALCADMQARAWAELGNAHRVADQLRFADLAFAKAYQRFLAGTGLDLIEARIAELTASLRCAQRDFREAFRELERAERIYTLRRDAHEIGRILIQKGLYSGYDGDPEGALELLERGIRQIDQKRAPKLFLLAYHNLLWFQTEVGLYQEARKALFTLRPMYEWHGGKLDGIKLAWLEGRISLGLGDLERAERAFTRAREGFAQECLRFRGAIVSLDLAAVWMLQGGKDDQVLELVQNLVHLFRDLGVEREGLAALLLLRDQLRAGLATADVLRLTARRMERLAVTRRPEGEERRG
jgi:tetratricopeptide (TPR) repeat protein